jgi:hypothetical protein
LFVDVLREDPNITLASSNFDQLYLNLDQKIKQMRVQKQSFEEHIILKFISQTASQLSHSHKATITSHAMQPQNFIYLDGEIQFFHKPLDYVDPEFDEDHFKAPAPKN